MQFRGHRKQTLKNDGLPIVNGKKVVRRSTYDSRGYDNSSASFVSRHFWKIFLTTLIMIFYKVYVDKNGSPTAGSSVVSTASQQGSVKTVQQNGEYPPMCTPQQKTSLQKVLKSSDMISKLSPAKYDPVLMRKFYGSDNFKLNANDLAFFGVILNWNMDDAPIETLRIGSRNAKYNTASWNKEIGYSTPLSEVSIDFSTLRPAKVLVLDDGTKSTSVQILQEKLGYSKEELDYARKPSSVSDYFDTIVKRMPNGKADHPIHYMDLRRDAGLSINIFQNIMPLLSNTRFLHFEQNKRNNWTYGSIVELSRQLKSKGLVCYYDGPKEDNYPLYRITDCALVQYLDMNWLSVSCVNVKHSDTKHLADLMEQRFQKLISN